MKLSTISIEVRDVRGGETVAQTLEFSGEADAVWLEWETVIWPMCVGIEDTCFEAVMLDGTGKLLEVCGLDEQGYTQLNEAPPARVMNRVSFEP